MSKGFVLFDNKTTHAGEVIFASSTLIVEGKKVAVDSCCCECGCQIISRTLYWTVG